MQITPSSQPNDPLGWAGNQSGHVLMGAFTAALLVYLGATSAVGLATVFVVWVVLWEVIYQWRILGGSGRDGLTDSAFFLWGGLYTFADGAFWWTFVASVALLAGMRRRI